MNDNIGNKIPVMLIFLYKLCSCGTYKKHPSTSPKIKLFGFRWVICMMYGEKSQLVGTGINHHWPIIIIIIWRKRKAYVSFRG